MRTPLTSISAGGLTLVTLSSLSQAPRPSIRAGSSARTTGFITEFDSSHLFLQGVIVDASQR